MSSTQSQSSAFLPYPSSFSPHLQTLLQRLHTASSTQEAAISPTEAQKVHAAHATSLANGIHLEDNLMRDKFIALDQDKALLVYNLIIASGATNIVEIGTSFGVSTLYLAIAALENAAKKGEISAKVIATEKETSKAEIARGHWREAGAELDGIIELRVGDLKETLKKDVGEVGFVLLDIWPHVALPALELLLPKLKHGAVILTDNTIASAEGYKDLLRVLREPKGPFSSLTLPYKGGLEFSVYKQD